MRDPRRIHRILQKVEKAWKKKPDQRLLELLLTLAQDPEKRLEPSCIDDDHLEQILDKKVPKTKMILMYEHLFEIAYRSLSPKGRAEIEAFIRDLKAMTMREFKNTEGIWKMGVKDWYAVKLDNYRIAMRPVPEYGNVIELLDILNEKTIQFFKAQQKKESKQA